MLARLEHVQRHPEIALENMYSAERLLTEHQLLPRYSIWVKCTLARLWIDRGNLEKASDLVQKAVLLLDKEIPYLDEPQYLILLRLHPARVESEAALALSQRLLQKAEAANQIGRVIKVLILQALTFHFMKDTDQGLKVLERALSLARPEGYVRSFLDEGKQMILQLHQAKSRGIQLEYISELLSGTRWPWEETPVSRPELAEPLSRREVEVLKPVGTACVVANFRYFIRLFLFYEVR